VANVKVMTQEQRIFNREPVKYNGYNPILYPLGKKYRVFIDGENAWIIEFVESALPFISWNCWGLSSSSRVLSEDLVNRIKDMCLLETIKLRELRGAGWTPHWQK